MLFSPQRSYVAHSFRIGLVLLACLSLGLHRGVVQGIAWTQMLVNYAGENSLLVAVEMTFDGQHPCPLCEVVKDDREAEHKQTPDSSQAGKKLHAVLASFPALIPPSAGDGSFSGQHFQVVCRFRQPEMPPPRRVMA